jgi:hypothetical protein
MMAVRHERHQMGASVGPLGRLGQSGTPAAERVTRRRESDFEGPSANGLRDGERSTLAEIGKRLVWASLALAPSRRPRMAMYPLKKDHFSGPLTAESKGGIGAADQQF